MQEGLEKNGNMIKLRSRYNFLQISLELFLGDKTDDPVNLLAIFEYQQRWDGHDLIIHGSFLIFVRVELDELDLAIHLLGYLF